jgi:hypothetical protein
MTDHLLHHDIEMGMNDNGHYARIITRARP